MAEIKKKKHPHFHRPNYGRKSRERIGHAWRTSRGIDNKKRLKLKYMGASPSIGHRNAKSVRNLHPLGLPEILAHNAKELIGAKNVVVRIAGGVGVLKRALIIKKAQELNLKVLNK
ncbi:50S ribosomal protein L32e [Candidatus Anstonella stagnisolia]|nr:50S ribosomal protein L32e [Candidatus Anstonella stagnisolia]